MKKLSVLFLTAILIFQPFSLALAQSQGEIRINQFSTLEGPDAMTLRLYFNVYDDRTGTPMLTVDAQSAQITLLNTNYTVEGQLKKPDVPIYITMVLDSSGSMGGAAEDLQDSAKLAFNNTPDNSLFSVVQFDEEIKLLQDFTENIPALLYAIDRYKVSRNGTCLYDATYSAVEAMAKAPAGRRAVILFTDGKDENKEGKQCSKHTYQELVDLAMKSQVPISTIGLSYNQGAINSLELESMAGSTGGISAVATQSNLDDAFEKIMSSLKAQWMLEAAIYPRRGNNDAVFNLTLKDGLSLNTAFTVTSNTDYPGPPSPVSARFAGLLLNAAKQSYEIQLDLTSSELVGYVKIEVWDSEAGSKVGEYTFDQPGPNNSFFVPTEMLTIGRDYQLHILAVGKADNIPFEIVRDDEGKGSTQLIHEFEFDPSSSYPTLKVQSL
ncbi:MAG TPA: VWA domain-containing protein, partial [Anaerolineales bacterium]|nr:VWA domain-containing protein [Anaerolineales bacterium]